MKTLQRLAFAVIVLGIATTASANTIWNLNNVNFNRPGFGTNTATGFFELNPSLTLVDWNVAITGTNTAANTTYNPATDWPGDNYNSGALVLTLAKFPANPQYMQLYFAGPLTNAGGTVPLVPLLSYVCDGCATLTSGSVTTQSVPEPMTVALLGTAAAGLVVRRRRAQA